MTPQPKARKRVTDKAPAVESFVPNCPKCECSAGPWKGEWTCINPECAHKLSEEEVKESREDQAAIQAESSRKP